MQSTSSCHFGGGCEFYESVLDHWFFGEMFVERVPSWNSECNLTRERERSIIIQWSVYDGANEAGKQLASSALLIAIVLCDIFLGSGFH